MVRQRLLGSVRLSLVIALLGTLLVATAGGVSAAGPAIGVTPGTPNVDVYLAGNWPIPFTTFGLPYTTIATTIDVDCGGGASCSVWVTRNNAAKSTEALFTNVTGSRTGIPVAFINDGCFNFRLYDAAHVSFLTEAEIGHTRACGLNRATAGASDGILGVNRNYGEFIRDFAPPSGPSASAPSNPLTIDWDSGGQVPEDAQIWITPSKPGAPVADCFALAYPNANEVLYAQNVSGEKADLNLIGGGPYCVTLYRGTTRATRIARIEVAIEPYLVYAGGTASFSSGNGSTNALVCVTGASTGGATVPFAFNSQGYASKAATFQTAGAGANTYTLSTGVTNLAGDGSATAASCGTGTTATSFTVTS